MVINTHRFLLKTLDDYDGVVGKALLTYRTCINEICTKPMCTIDKCLYCDNCYYNITLENGDVLSNSEADLSKINNYDKGIDDDDHEILFYDHVPLVDDLFGYLFDDNSQFRIVRKEDKVIVYDHVSSYKKMVKKNI